MANVAVLAAALTDHGARHATLTVAGLDLLQQPGGGYFVPVESIEHTERGPGSVSELRFDVWDLNGDVVLSRNDPVSFAYTATPDPPIFQGFVTSWAPYPLGTTGQRIEVRCDGLEIVLDWAKVDALTIPAGMGASVAIQLAVASVLNGLAYPLNTASGAGSVGAYDFPVGDGNGTVANGVEITAGTTLREAIRAILDDAVDEFGTGVPRADSCTVDSRGGLRVWPNVRLATDVIDGFGGAFDLFVTDAQSSPADGTGTVGSPMVAENVRFENDATTPAAVYVVGDGVTALVHDGTGGQGDLAVLNDSSLTTAEQCRKAGLAYLGQRREQRRGYVRLPNKAPNMTFRAGSTIAFTDAMVGAVGTPMLVHEVVRRFHGDLEDWEVTFGGSGEASMVAENRRLTRGILS